MLLKLKNNTGTRTNKNELARNEINLENKNKDSSFQSSGIALQSHSKDLEELI